MSWNNLFLTLYKMIQSKDIETPKMDDFMRSLYDSDNRLKIAFYIWRAYYNNENKKIEFWGQIFREMIDFIKANENKPRNILIRLGEPITERHGDNDITQVYYYIIKEIELK